MAGRGNRFIDLSSQTFGRLTVLRCEGPAKNRIMTWRCVCSCGNEVVCRGDHLREGKILSCGCLNQENRHTNTRTHGDRHTRLYNIWTHMKQRCKNQNRGNFKHYGGRGIKICPEWEHDFIVFRDWALANGYRDDLTIDRIDNDGDYCPENCRWATPEEQLNNTHRNHRIIVNGEEMTIAEASRRYKVPYDTIQRRISCGWSPERAIKGGE